MTQLTITEQIILKTYPSAKTDVIEFINEFKDKYNINTKKRLAAFIAICMDESWGFRKTEDSFKFSVTRLRQTYPTIVTSVIKADKLVKAGEMAVANYVLGGQYGNEGRDTNDGWSYRPQGYIKICGRKEYEELTASTGFDFVNNPSLIQQPKLGILAAMDWWNRNGCNLLADKLVLTADLNGLSKKGVNYSSSPSLYMLHKVLKKNHSRMQDIGLFFDAIIKQL